MQNAFVIKWRILENIIVPFFENKKSFNFLKETRLLYKDEPPKQATSLERENNSAPLRKKEKLNSYLLATVREELIAGLEIAGRHHISQTDLKGQNKHNNMVDSQRRHFKLMRNKTILYTNEV